MSSQDRIPQTLTTMEAAFALQEGKELEDEFWRNQERMGPIVAASPGFVAVIGGPIDRSHPISDPSKLIAPMLARFMATDREFVRSRKIRQEGNR